MQAHHPGSKAAYRERLRASPYPARSLIATPLGQYGILVEIEAIAVVGGRRLPRGRTGDRRRMMEPWQMSARCRRRSGTSLRDGRLTAAALTRILPRPHRRPRTRGSAPSLTSIRPPPCGPGRASADAGRGGVAPLAGLRRGGQGNICRHTADMADRATARRPIRGAPAGGGRRPASGCPATGPAPMHSRARRPPPNSRDPKPTRRRATRTIPPSRPAAHRRARPPPVGRRHAARSPSARRRRDRSSGRPPSAASSA